MVKQIVLSLASIVMLTPAIQAQTEIEGGVGLIILTDEPVFKGDLKKFIQENMRYPDAALRDSVEGRVVVQFMIDSLGFTKNHRIERGIRDDLDNEALRVARLIKFDSPAMQYDKVIRIEFCVPIDFMLNPIDSTPSKRKRERRQDRDYN